LVVNSIKPKLREQSGFTLIELVVAAVAFSMMAIAVFTAFTNIEIMNRRARNITIANQALQQQMELYRGTPFVNLPTAGTHDVTASLLAPYPSLGSPRQVQVVVTDVQPGALKRIDINLYYTESGKRKDIQLTTLITARGLNK
jgi:prepilin-type N-terminal cleavage/methylation domain-containing protein